MIVVDPRVGSRHLAPLFTALKVPFENEPLEFGDCMWLGQGPGRSINVFVVQA